MSLLYFSSADLMSILIKYTMSPCVLEKGWSRARPSKAFFKRHLRAVGHSWHIVFWKTSQVPFGPGWPGPVA